MNRDPRTVIGQTHCHGDVDVTLGRPPCAHCHPPCPKCPCYANEGYCGCFTFNHDCECHKAEYVDLSNKCDTCGPKFVRQKLDWLTKRRTHNPLPKYAVAEAKRRLKACTGDYYDKVKVLEDFEAEYDRAYDKLRLPYDWLVAKREVESKPCFAPRAEESPYRGSLQRSVWLHIAEKYRISLRRFPDYKSFLRHAEDYDEYGQPKNPPEIKFR